MSDPKTSYGEPVEEPRSVDDVVGHAEEGLADAEAARRDAVADESTPVVVAEPVDSTPADDEPVVAPAATPAAADDAEPEFTTAADYEAAYRDASADDTAVVAAPVATQSYADAPTVATQSYSDAPTVAAAPVVAAAPAVQPIFVQAPEAPRPRGNRAAAGAIGVVAALCFAVLYVAAWVGFGILEGDVTVGEIVDDGDRCARHVVALGDGLRLLHLVLAARRHHQPRSLGRLGRLRTPGRLRVVRRAPARTALPGPVLDAHRQSKAPSSSRISCTPRWRSPRSSSAVS